MKIGIIGANGNLGRLLVRQALERKMEVRAFIRNEKCSNEQVAFVKKDLFCLTREDVQDLDVIISAFGSGFQVDPKINKEAFFKYIEILEQSHTRLVVIAGAGSLYTDASHTTYEYESKHHPKKLVEISKNIRLGIDALSKNRTFQWTVVCPSRFFDLHGKYSGEYIVGQDHILYNQDNQSYVTYEDLASAMLDIVQTNMYPHQIITVASKKGGV